MLMQLVYQTMTCYLRLPLKTAQSQNGTLTRALVPTWTWIGCTPLPTTATSTASTTRMMVHICSVVAMTG